MKSNVSKVEKKDQKTRYVGFHKKNMKPLKFRSKLLLAHQIGRTENYSFDPIKLSKTVNV